MRGRSVWLVLVAAATFLPAACSSDAASDRSSGSTAVAAASTDGTGPSGATTSSGGTAGPAPIVDPASVEAFCALDRQLDGLAEQQLADADVNDREAFRLAMATFVTDNAAVIDQYVAAAPSEISDDVNATMAQTRAAVDDADLFAALLSGTGDTSASNRVSAFIEANCPA